mmetsp:Transcript_18845/g.41063  ORF Transcript_18845/g.41063 Transcript_18845/m.41063 type:complete len:228 (-) Transcript_18845:786-1469(-)
MAPWRGGLLPSPMNSTRYLCASTFCRVSVPLAMGATSPMARVSYAVYPARAAVPPPSPRGRGLRLRIICLGIRRIPRSTTSRAGRPVGASPVLSLSRNWRPFSLLGRQISGTWLAVPSRGSGTFSGSMPRRLMPPTTEASRLWFFSPSVIPSTSRGRHLLRPWLHSKNRRRLMRLAATRRTPPRVADHSRTDSNASGTVLPSYQYQLPSRRVPTCSFRPGRHSTARI